MKGHRKISCPAHSLEPGWRENAAGIIAIVAIITEHIPYLPDIHVHLPRYPRRNGISPQAYGNASVNAGTFALKPGAGDVVDRITPDICADARVYERWIGETDIYVIDGVCASVVDEEEYIINRNRAIFVPKYMHAFSGELK